MEFEDWEPVYEEICLDFGYDRAGDERARDRLATLLGDQSLYTPEKLQWDGKRVAIAGGASTLGTNEQLEQARTADVVVAASVAADRLRDNGIDVDCMVTDLDKNPGTVRTLTNEGTPVVVHAHGDNIPALEEWVPRIDAEFVIPTTQARPTDRVLNFGGFTDGDRAAFLADVAGASRLLFPGWDFDDADLSAEKERKLRWAARLLYWLELRRDETFEILDGKREEIDTTALPVE